jgi:ABC-type glycerol-3-phosphate transport system substrate-binding protein
MSKKYSRRDMLRLSGLAGVGILAAACTQAVPGAQQVVTVEVEKVVTVEVEKAGDQPPALEANLVWDTFRGPGTGWNEERISTFRDEHPGVTIDFRPLTGSSQQDNYGKMYALHAAGDLGDVIAFDPSHFHFWRAINKDIIGPLDEFVQADDLDLSGWFEQFIVIQHFQGKLYGLPSWGWAGFDSLVTNAVHFEEAGVDLPDPTAHDTSMETIAEWARTFYDPDNGRYGLNLGHGEISMVALTRAFNGFLINEEGTKCLLLEDEGSQEALRWAYQLAVEEKVLPNADDLGTSGPAAQLEGKLTMDWSGSLNVRNFKRDIKDESVAKAHQILLPTRADGKFPSQLRGGTWNINKSSQAPDVAYKFVTHIAGKEGCFGFNLVAGQGALVRPDVVELLIAQDPVHEWFIPNLENGIPAHAPANSRGREYTDAVQQWTDLLLDKNQPVPFEEGLQNLHDNIQRVLDEPPA